MSKNENEKPKIPQKEFNFTESRFWQKSSRNPDLLAMNDNKPSPMKKTVNRDGGDWFAHGSDEHTYVKKNTPEVKRKTFTHDPNRSTTNALPGGQERVIKAGRKTFQASNRDAPFATSF